MSDTIDLEGIREGFTTSSWALWSDRYPKRGCIEEDPGELIDYIEGRTESLRPEVVFLGLNPSTKAQSEAPGTYSNFHSPSLAHRDCDLRIIAEETGLEGSYMTDLSEKATPDSSEIDASSIDTGELMDQLERLGQDHYHLICFGRSTYNLLRKACCGSDEGLDESIETFSFTDRGIMSDVYSVYHYSQQDGQYTEALRDQLAYLSTDRIDSG